MPPEATDPPPSSPEPAPITTAPAPAMTPAPGPARAPAPRPSRAGFLRRLQVGTGVLLQVALLAFIVLAINGYAFKHFKRFDFSRDRKYSLSERTKQYLASLTKPVKLIVFMSGRSPVLTDVSTLAREYRDAQPKLIQLEEVNPFKDVSRATDLQTKYKLAQQEDVVIVDSEGRSKIISDDKLAEVDTSGEMMGQPPQITAFTGEQAITSAIIEVSEGKKSTVYYLQGHGEGELAPDKPPLDHLNTLLEAEHLSVAPLNLLNVDTVPADCSTLLILGPHSDLTDREIKLLSAFWDKGGHLLLLLNPDSATPHLAAFLDRLGVTPDDDRVLRTLNLAGGVMGIVRDTVTEFTGSTQIAKQLAGMTPVFLGGAQSLTLKTAGGPSGVTASPLLQALEGFWGETDYKDLENTGATYDAGKDKAAPLTIAAIVEKGAVGDQRVQAGGSRLIVVGNARFVQNDALDERTASFFVSSLDWLLEREALIGIAPREVKMFSLNLPETQVQQILWITVLAIPAGFAFIGFLVWWRRRA